MGIGEKEHAQNPLFKSLAQSAPPKLPDTSHKLTVAQRYVLLLQDLCKHTHAGHPDYEKLNQALKKMKDVADYVNERKREAENLTQVNTTA